MTEVSCRNCGAVFDLATQWYYDEICPSCKAEVATEASTHPVCCYCNERYDPADGVVARVQNRGMPGSAERVEVCSQACQSVLERDRRRL